jgi:protein ImuA
MPNLHLNPGRHPMPMSRRGQASFEPAPGVRLALARVHEICGSARVRAGLWLAGQTQGPVLWISMLHGGTVLNTDGLAALIAPGRMIFVTAERAEDALWAMEEAVRSGHLGAVVAEFPSPPAMTPVRRLHLAAEATRPVAPLVLILTPEDGGAPGVESRWQMEPAHGRATGVPASGLRPDLPSAEPLSWWFACLRARGLGSQPRYRLRLSPEGRGMVLVENVAFGVAPPATAP